MIVCTSTADSNRRSRFYKGMPFLGFELWVSHGDGHTKEGGKGMGTEPGGMNECSSMGVVADKYQSEALPGIASMEDLAVSMGIVDYVRFICGYHIQGQAATMYDPQYCALDWYCQSAAQRPSNPDVWEHYLILDQVCPTECIKSEAFKRMPMYPGWYGHKVGSA